MDETKVRANLQRSIQLQRQSSELRKESTNAGFAFLKTDLETGLILARMALQAGEDSEKKRRNQYNARRAYDTVSVQVRDLALRDCDVCELQRLLSCLRCALEQVGELF